MTRRDASPGDAVRASAERAVAVGRDVRTVVTGDGAKVADTFIEHQTVYQAPAPASSPSAQEVTDAVAHYALRVAQVYGRVDLGVLTPPGEAQPTVRLPEVFVAPTVRADPPPVQLPRELQRRALESGWLLDDELLPPGTDTDAFERLRNSYLERPEQCVLETLAGPSGRRAVLLGDPGAGKSTLIRYLALTLLRGEPDGALHPLKGLVPLVVELRQYADDRWHHSSFEAFLDHQHSDFALSVPPAVREELLAEGRALMIFDGLDEIFDRKVRAEATQRIAAFAARWSSTRILVTSRVIGYQRAALDSAGFTHFKIQDLDEERISTFAEHWYRNTCPDDPVLARELTERFTSATENSRPLQEMAGNPLLLTILAIIGRSPSLPRNRRDVYEHAVTILVARWDEDAKMLKTPLPPAVAEALAVLGPSRRLKLLRLLAHTMQEGRNGIAGNHIHRSDLERVFRDHLQRYGVPPAQATPAAQAMIDQLRERNFILAHYGGDFYGFVHRAFLEYLTAADIAHRYKEEGHWTSKGLIDQVVAARAADPAWHEVLLLLIGQLNSGDATAAIDRLLDLHARRTDLTDARYVILALRALAERGKIAALSNQSVAAIDAVTAVLNTRGSKGPWLLAEAWSALASFSRYWAGREPYLRWYRLSGQFSPSDEPAALLAIALKLDDDELAALARGSYYGFDRLTLLHALGERRPDDDATRELVLREATLHPGYRVRSVALEVLGEVWKGREDVRAFLIARAAEDPKANTRGTALEVLGAWWSDDDDIRELISHAATHDDHPFVRGDALRTLGRQWHDREDIRSLLIRRVLDDQDDNIRGTALQTLERRCSGYQDVLDFLAQRAADDTDPDLCRHAIWVLGKSARGDHAIRDLLIQRATDSSDDGVREAALRALGMNWPAHVGVRDALVRAVTDDPSPKACSTALRELGARWSRHENVRNLILRRAHKGTDEEVRRTAIEVMSDRYRDDDDALEVLSRAATDETQKRVREQALRVLAEQWAQQTQVRDLLLRAYAGISDGWTRATVLRGLAEHWPDRQDVHKLLLTAADHPYRFTSATALDDLRDHWPDRDDARAVLMRIVTEHDDWLVGSAAMKVLAKRWMDRADVRAFVMRVATDPSHPYRGTVLDVLCEHWAYREDVRDVLIRAVADHADKDTGAKAVKVLGLRWGDHRGVQELFRRRAAVDPDPHVRFSSLRWWVVKAGEDEGQALLGIRAVEDPDPEVRRKILHMLALNWPGHPRTAAVLQDRALHDEDESTKAAAHDLRALTTRPGP
ncbi:HEAT repeat domain-containing protein [Streptomyces ipomoeae]|uniref:HEAT repeat domain-containing protein n=1 Tax=Streptomyces ipomoeae TaxID=103232 RepID=UPI001146360F|nr:HEAT repeat domain-containing protein [Streptomyces ipomoeae]MDX2932827.1 HEAT repeat domain-containing protein [Streptomyces ipomoeae]TQE26041.1 NACHT domain-containing protein [Streptomyces ipomoeae]